MSDPIYMIIGGATKSGTTSLYKYLADHPQVCASSLKETRFFVDPDYPLPVKFRFEDWSLAKYEEYFAHRSDKPVRLEATPDYLYSPGTPKKIKTALPAVKLIFILREPVDRLISWFRFAKQVGQLPADCSFGEYVRLQLQTGGQNDKREQHLRALEQGRYSVYLKPYLELFGREDIYIAQYAGLKNNAKTLIAEICSFAGLDVTYYDNYYFDVHNRTIAIRNAAIHSLYLKFGTWLYFKVYDRQRVRVILRFLRRRFDPLYTFFNTRSDGRVAIAQSLEKTLRDYYSDEAKAMAGLLGLEKFSWSPIERVDAEAAFTDQLLT